ncbi:hypothetical protein KO02_17445 [Sphingobacterium sp. ML3W]|nr:hypothetical protein KO02_17445 [Sphingobacterium sp. ML3W]
MHSPWGLLNQISDKKGWTQNYMLEEISWVNLQMYMVDQVKMIKRSSLVIKGDSLKERRKKYNNGKSKTGD